MSEQLLAVIGLLGIALVIFAVLDEAFPDWARWGKPKEPLGPSDHATIYTSASVTDVGVQYFGSMTVEDDNGEP